MCSDRFTLEGKVESAPKGVHAQHTDYERSTGIGETAAGPVDEFREIVEERRFDFIFAGSLRLGSNRLWHRGKEQESNRAECC
jgi:hypothetical protein